MAQSTNNQLTDSRHVAVVYRVPPYPMVCYHCAMSHTIHEKSKLLARVRRIRGQVEAIEHALEQEADCERVMHLIAGVRGATSGLMAAVMEDHVRNHLIDVEHQRGASATDAAQQLVEVVHAYLK